MSNASDGELRGRLGRGPIARVARHIPYIVKIPNSTDPEAENTENAQANGQPAGKFAPNSFDYASASAAKRSAANPRVS